VHAHMWIHFDISYSDYLASNSRMIHT